MITEPTEPQNNPEEFWPNDDQKQDLLKLCEQITGESQTPSPLHRRRPNRGHPIGLRGFLTVAAAMAIALGLLSMGWFSSFYFFGVAEQAIKLQLQAETFENKQKQFHADQAERIVTILSEGKYRDALIAIDGLDSKEFSYSKSRSKAMLAIFTEVYGKEVDLSAIQAQIESLEKTHASNWE